MTKSVIITAGGIGYRMGADLPKQFLLLDKKPILMHTISKFHEYDNTIEVILVLPSGQIEAWKNLCGKYSFTLPYKVVEGGEHRFNSVKNGLLVCSGELIAVHDGVRPLVSSSVIGKCFEEAETHGAVIPVIQIKESIRRVIDGDSVARNRQDFRIVQTPQCFKKEILLNAYNQEYNPSFTDDASLVENAGNKIFLIDGNEENIKITTKNDLKLAESLIK